MLKLSYKALALATTLALVSACSNDDSKNDAPPQPALAKGLHYSNPSSSGWRLEADASSSSTRIVLNLVGPNGLKSRGVGFNLQADQRVQFGGFANGSYAHDSGVFNLKNSQPDEYTAPIEPTFFASGVMADNVLTTGIFQKDRRINAALVDKAVVQVALEFDANKFNGVKASESLALNVVKARMIAEDIGGTDQDTRWIELVEKAQLQNIEIAVGQLVTL